MKQQITSRRAALALGLVGIPFLVGCGSNNGTPAVAPPNAAVCAANPAYPGCTGLVGGCVPPTTPIAFTATGMYMGSANLLGGMIPLRTGDPAGGQTYGQVVVAAAGSLVAPNGTGLTFTRTAVDATVMLNINSVTYGTNTATPYSYGASGMGTTTGTGACRSARVRSGSCTRWPRAWAWAATPLTGQPPARARSLRHDIRDELSHLALS